MKKSIIILIVIVALIAVVGFGLAGSYNSLAALREDVNSSMSVIDVQLKRRADLIPNLVNTVKGFAAHETEAIQNVSDARSRLAGAGTMSEKAAADSELSGALSRLLMVVENYPDLKADANFRQLSDELAGTENRISTARIDYNNKAKEFNSRIARFPTNILAGMFGFEKFSYFEASDADKETPTVDFGQ